MKATDYITVDADDYRLICKNGGGYEYIPDDKPVKLYLDVDVKLPMDDQSDVDTYLSNDANIVRKDIYTVLQKSFGEKYIENQIYRGSSHGIVGSEFKISYRIIINNIIALKSHQKQIVKELNRNASIICDDTEEYYPNGMFDINPYSKENQIIRSAYTSKPKQDDRIMQIEEGTFEMSCITAFIPEDATILTMPDIVKPEKIYADNQTEENQEVNRYIFNKAIEYGLLTPYSQSGEYSNWIKIGFIIKNVFDNRELWHTFSKLGGKIYDRDNCDDVFDKMDKKMDGVGIGSLIYLINQTDKKNNTNFVKKIFDKLRENNIYKWMQFERSEKSVYFNNKDIALLFHSAIPNRVVTVDDETYYYNGVYWKLCSKSFAELQLCLSSEFINHINKYRSIWTTKLMKRIDAETDPDKKKLHQTTLDNMNTACSSIISILYSNKKRRSFVDEVILYSHNNNIIFNQCVDLFAFNNCVFDLKTQKKQETPNPKDYINITTGYNYDDMYDSNKINTLNKIIDGIHQNVAIRDFFLQLISTSLIGDHIQKMVILTGRGGNGKGLIMKLLSSAIGNYAYTLSDGILTEDLKEGANPALAAMNGKRLVKTSEPKKRSMLRMDTIKKITGENIVNARMNYSNKTDCFMNNLLVMEANDIPLYDQTGDAIDRRMIIIPFNSQAVTKEEYDASVDKTNLTILNTTYDTDEWRNEYKQAYFHILLEHLKIFYTNGKNIPKLPKECKDATDKQASVSDTIISFITNKYVQDDDNYQIIKLKTLYQQFQVSHTFYALSKEEKRLYNYTYFCNLLSENRMLSKYIVQRDGRYRGIGAQIKAVSLCGWKEIVDIRDDETDEETN